MNCFVIPLMVMVAWGAEAPATTPTGKLQPLKFRNPGLTVDLGVGLWAIPLPMDYDGDGDFDLVVGCEDVPARGIYFFENTQGNVKLPVFKAPVRLANVQKDLMPSYTNAGVRVFSRDRELVDFKANKFEKVVAGPKLPKFQSGGKVRTHQHRLVDFDGDGLLDLIVALEDWTDYGWDNAYDKTGKWVNGPLHGYVNVVKNTGTNDKPIYAKAERVQAGGKDIDVYGRPTPSFEDFDGDGDLDLFCGEFVDGFTYFENVGTRKEPKYAAGRQVQHAGKDIRMDLCMIWPIACDWDHDGDVDVIVGQEDGKVAFLEHTGKIENGTPAFLPPQYFKQEADDVRYGVLVMPIGVDWDSDGDEDIIAGNAAGRVGFIENLDGKNPPTFAAPVDLKAGDEVLRVQAGMNGSIQGPCERKWGYVCPSVGDWDHDGKLDLVLNSIWGKVVWYRNIGTAKEPKLAAAAPVEVEWEGPAQKPKWNWWDPKGKELATQWRSTALIHDLNRDGLNDLVTLDVEGYLCLYERQKKGDGLILLPPKRVLELQTQASPRKTDPLRLNAFEAGKSGRRMFVFADWDQDGKSDLLLNARNVDFYRNVSESEGERVFAPQGLVDERILAGHNTGPAVVDWNKDKIPDLIVGAEDGRFYYMQNPTAK